MKKILIFILLLVSIIAIPTNVLADTGPKPSIEVNIKNLKTSNYIIDLFVYDKEAAKKNTGPSSFGDTGLTDAEEQQLYELNYDGWISASTRAGLIIFSNCAGNSDHENGFGYFGTPNRYKVVIINNDTGDIKITDEIVRKELNSVITVDYETMKVTGNINITKTIIIVLLALVLTIGLETLIALLFKTKNYGTVLITNIITNVLLQTVLLFFANNYLVTFIVGEVLVISAELIVYLLRFKNISKLKTVIYTLVANLSTIIISLILYRM